MDNTINSVDFYPETYQQVAKEWIIDHPGCALFLNMGAGKTAITLSAVMELLYDRLEVRRVLVVAPLRVAGVAWPDELGKWRMVKGLRWAVCEGREDKRRKVLFGDYDVVVLPVSQLIWAVEAMVKARDIPYDMLVVDELSLFKNSRSARFMALRKIRDRFTRFVGLTGTPTSNGYADLFAQVWLIDGGRRLGSFVSRYYQRYFTPTYSVGGIGAGWVLRPGAEIEIQEAISDVCLYLDTPASVDLPPLFFSDIRIEPGKALRAQYRQFVHDCLLGVGDSLIVADNAAILSGKLLQFCSGRIYTGDGRVTHLHDLKINALRDIVRRDTSPVLVFYAFDHSKSRIMEALEDYGPRELRDREDIEAWNRGEIRVALAHPKSAGHGLNLQYGGHRIVYYSLPWSLEEYAQSYKRLHRRGQTEPVTVYRLLLSDTIDERVARVLAGKSTTQRDLLESLKREFRAVEESGL